MLVGLSDGVDAGQRIYFVRGVLGEISQKGTSAEMRRLQLANPTRK